MAPAYLEKNHKRTVKLKAHHKEYQKHGPGTAVVEWTTQHHRNPSWLRPLSKIVYLKPRSKITLTTRAKTLKEHLRNHDLKAARKELAERRIARVFGLDGNLSSKVRHLSLELKVQNTESVFKNVTGYERPAGSKVKHSKS